MFFLRNAKRHGGCTKNQCCGLLLTSGSGPSDRFLSSPWERRSQPSLACVIRSFVKASCGFARGAPEERQTVSLLWSSTSFWLVFYQHLAPGGAGNVIATAHAKPLYVRAVRSAVVLHCCDGGVAQICFHSVKATWDIANQSGRRSVNISRFPGMS